MESPRRGEIYIIDSFQEKSRRGIATPRQEIRLIEKRLQRAREDYEQWQKEEQ